jgi:hypothetical protein
VQLPVRVHKGSARGKKHALLQAGCGMEKTLGSRIPLLTKPPGILIIVSLLTLLGDQRDLCAVGIRAINVDTDVIAETPRTTLPW